jgi:hypothetical protein
LKVGDLVKYSPDMRRGTPTIIGIVMNMLDSHYVDVFFMWDGHKYTKQVDKRDLKVISSSDGRNDL